MLALGLLSSACLGGQTGAENNGEDSESRPASEGSLCDDEATPLEPDEMSPLGFSANELLENVAASYATDLAWSINALVSFGPETGTVPFSLEVAAIGDASFVHSVPKPPEGGGAGPAIGVQCPPDRVVVSVEIVMTSGGGALAERFPADLEATDAELATFRAPLRLDELAGSFEADAGTATTTELVVSGMFGGAGTAGTLSGPIDVSDGQVASHFVVEYAHWPAENPCPTDTGGVAVPVPLETALDGGTSAADALALFSPGLAQLRWSSGESTEISLSATTNTALACLVPADPLGTPGRSLLVPVQVALRTGDGRLASVLSGTVAPEGASTRLRASRTCEGVSIADSLFACGVSGLDASGYSGVLLSLDATLDTEGATPLWGGGLEILGVGAEDDCVDTDMQACPGGGAMPIETGTLENE